MPPSPSHGHEGTELSVQLREVAGPTPLPSPQRRKSFPLLEEAAEVSRGERNTIRLMLSDP